MAGNRNIKPTLMTSLAILFTILQIIFPVALCRDRHLSKNLALHKPTKQVYTLNPYYMHDSSNAVDGDQNTTYSSASCTHTGIYTAQNWWLVDLQKIHLITAVRITNRADDLGWRLYNFSVEMTLTDPVGLRGFPGSAEESNLCFRQNDAIPEGQTVLFDCPKPILGRYVRLLKYQENSQHRPLSICELEVYESVLRQWYLKPHKIYQQPDPDSPRTSIVATLPGPVSRIRCAASCAENIALRCMTFQFHVPSGTCYLSLSVQTNGLPMDENPLWLAYNFPFSL